MPAALPITAIKTSTTSRKLACTKPREAARGRVRSSKSGKEPLSSANQLRIIAIELEEGIGFIPHGDFQGCRAVGGGSIIGFPGLIQSHVKNSIIWI